MSHKELRFEYVVVKGILSTIIAVLLVMVAIVSLGTLPFDVVFNIPTMLGSLVAICVIFFALSYILSRQIQKIDSKMGLVLYIAFAVFASIELFNIFTAIVTRSVYYPSNPAFYGAFWTSRLFNLAISCAATGVVAYITKKDLLQM
jgi:FtsH-binding integral membrane protein